ncbi:helix-turn-helix domain-containing protein [Klebsiella aerogenes]|uniref:helix-turn-helix domain-containing protein n=1 Tax=Klebsiella aerogenes TaxID=548 RepID=UPI0027721192|nr:helix-turn-helix transcriptional regulator [Klebsiella aerogenes]HDS6533869.1 helix-turn-helix transcriptional regulator [Klebsiella aerogenes]HDS9641922.1 helix-turn-helix transcriptional regulator [Klebsiella aerogenes]HDT1124604.1 helix-turn-helix transcriptional regulator [Klebsiella aerogenes]HDU4094019.1 helix-turn-helix transcriptional regulator [Klebsiella aerogenes]
MDSKNGDNFDGYHKMRFGKRLAQAMLLTKHTNASLAKEIGVSEPMVKKYVDGKNLPKADVLQRISLALGLDVSLLLDVQDAGIDTEEKDLIFLNQMFQYLTGLQRKVVLRQVNETISKLLKLEEQTLQKNEK